ncbi:MAG: DUF1573 domain-containing protein [Acidobacteria bacterium]|nr:DUF1573 domain-containing protein [Acidobacteriota bacterium]
MSDEFGTVSIRRGDRAREIEVIRQHYRAHRDALSKMMADAPTEHLAAEYQRLLHEIDTALSKLDDLDVQATAAGAAPVPPPPPPVAPPSLDRRTEPGNRPLVQPPSAAPLPPVGAYEPPMETSGSGSRVLLIVIIGVVVLGVIGWLIWRASDRGAQKPIVEAPATTATRPITDTAVVTPAEPTRTATTAPAPAAESGSLKISPAMQDYGTIRKGTRAVRQFEVTNLTSQPLAVNVARSHCKCLYYDYHAIAPKKKETFTVTIDGARAPAGDLRETLAITGKDKSVLGQLEISATIK